MQEFGFPSIYCKKLFDFKNNPNRFKISFLKDLVLFGRFANFLVDVKYFRTNVRMINASFIADTREMNSVVVKVCTNGKSCKQCGGYSDDVPTKQWSVFECSKPLQGNEIQIEQGSYYFLAFCEVEIRGDPAPITTTTTTTRDIKQKNIK